MPVLQRNVEQESSRQLCLDFKVWTPESEINTRLNQVGSRDLTVKDFPFETLQSASYRTRRCRLSVLTVVPATGAGSPGIKAR